MNIMTIKIVYVLIVLFGAPYHNVHSLQINDIASLEECQSTYRNIRDMVDSTGSDDGKPQVSNISGKCFLIHKTIS